MAAHLEGEALQDVSETGLSLISRTGLDDHGDARSRGRSSALNAGDLDTGNVGDGRVSTPEGGSGLPTSGKSVEERHGKVLLETKYTMY